MSMASFLSQFEILQTGYSGLTESQLPIQLPWTKVYQWLSDCKISKPGNDWRTKNQHLQKEISKSLHELMTKYETTCCELAEDRQHALKECLSKAHRFKFASNSPMTYFDCVAVLDALLKYSEEQKNKKLFGTYSSITLRAWEAYTKQFSKDNMHFVHSAYLIQHVIKYELPMLNARIKKNIERLKLYQTQKSSLSNHYAKLHQQYVAQCKRHSLNPVPVDVSLDSSTLEDILNTLAKEKQCSLCNLITTHFQSNSQKLKACTEFFRQETEEHFPIQIDFFYLSKIIEGEFTVNEKENHKLELVSLIDSSADCPLKSENSEQNEYTDQTISKETYQNKDKECKCSLSQLLQPQLSDQFQSDACKFLFFLNGELEFLLHFLIQKHHEIESLKAHDKANSYLFDVLKYCPLTQLNMLELDDKLAAIDEHIKCLNDALKVITNEQTKENVLIEYEYNRIKITCLALVKSHQTMKNTHKKLEDHCKKILETEHIIKSCREKYEDAKSATAELASSLEKALSEYLKGRPVKIRIPTDY